jgi:hypothetical protein
MLHEMFESLAACSKFIMRSESPFGQSAAQKLLKQVTQTPPEAPPGQNEVIKQVAPLWFCDSKEEGKNLKGENKF